MFMEGEVNWSLILGIAAGLFLVWAVVATFLAVRHGADKSSASGELDMVQKVAEAADKRLFQTLNAIPVALVETDRQGKFVFANRAAQQLLGRKDAELLGLRFHSATWGITFPDGRPVPADMLPSARALRGQTVKNFQHMLANAATRRKMLVSVTAMPIEDERGSVIGSTAAIVEADPVAAAAWAAPDPAEAEPPPEDLTRRVFAAAPSALVLADRGGAVLELNPVAEAMADRSAEGRDFADLFLPEDARAAARQAIRAALARPDDIFGPLEAGAVRWTLLPLPGADGGADVVLLAGEAVVAEDRAPEPAADVAPEPDPAVAERDAAQARVTALAVELEEAQAAAKAREATLVSELEAARRLEGVGRLTGGVAQDFHALLTVMTGALDLLLRQADDPARVRRLGEAALTAGRRGEALTRRLSAFSQGEDGPPERVVDAAVLLRAGEGRLRELAGPGTDLLIEAPAEPVWARLDPLGFDGAVQALVRNAVEAAGHSGSVAVRLQATEGGELRLSVRDSGPGMDAGLAARALEPFFTTKAGASGLGLSQAHAFARASGGRLTIDSREGEGAEVSITLPAVEAAEDAA
jgi:PAS domain S-box-containing protein